MSLRKRGSVWWIDIAAPSGERVRRSAETGNKAQAQELHDKLRSELWRLQKLGDRLRRIWQDAAPAGLRSRDQAALCARANFLRMHVQKGGGFVEIEGSHDSGLREMTAYLRTVAAATWLAVRRCDACCCTH